MIAASAAEFFEPCSYPFRILEESCQPHVGRMVPSFGFEEGTIEFGEFLILNVVFE